MRKIKVFKARSKTKMFLLDCSKKILKFKRPKWSLYLIDLKKDLSRKYFISASVSTSSFNLNKDHESLLWDKSKLFYKKKLNLRQNILHSYDNSFKKDLVKKNALGNSFKSDSFVLFKNIVVKLEYNLAFLLFRLNFFHSVFESRKKIDLGFVYVNSLKVSKNYFIKSGDVISFRIEDFDCKANVLKNFKRSIFIPFVEIDYYTNVLIVIKDFKDLSFEDITLFYSKHNNISNYRLAFNRS